MSVDCVFNMQSGLRDVIPQFTLTCISAGGPATTVTWTRDSVALKQGTKTELDDAVTAQYTHTLTYTGRLGGLYTCTVSNEKPAVAHSSIFVEGRVKFAGLPKLCNSTIFTQLPHNPVECQQYKRAQQASECLGSPHLQ